MWGVFGRARTWQRPFFGQPAVLLEGEKQWVLGGPLTAEPRAWQWVAYSGPLPACRVLGTAKWKVAPRVLPRRRHGAGYLAVQTLTAYYLLRRDGEGLYVTAFARLLPEGWSMEAIHDELAEAAEWLRQAHGALDQERGYSA